MTEYKGPSRLDGTLAFDADGKEVVYPETALVPLANGTLVRGRVTQRHEGGVVTVDVGGALVTGFPQSLFPDTAA